MDNLSFLFCNRLVCDFFSFLSHFFSSLICSFYQRYGLQISSHKVWLVFSLSLWFLLFFFLKLVSHYLFFLLIFIFGEVTFIYNIVYVVGVQYLFLLYIYIYLFIFRFSFHVGYYRVLIDLLGIHRSLPIIYFFSLFFWLHRVLGATHRIFIGACGIFHCGMRSLCCSAWASL